MPNLSQHQSNEYTKMMVLGDPGSGKTGSLTSLVKTGYWLGILDYDNGLEPLKQYILRECPEKIDNVEYRTLRDKRKAGPEGPIIDGAPKAFVDGVKMLDRWKYKGPDGTEIDYGVPAEWGPDKIFVLDTLTMFSDAAFDFREPLVPRSRDGKYDKRAVYYDTQQAVESVIALLCSESFRTNVIVNTHIRYVENEDGTRKGYPNSIGQALATMIGAYFNSIALCQVGTGGKRTIRTAPTTLVDLKNPRPFAMLPQYPIETGLADFFAVLREGPKNERKQEQITMTNILKPEPKRPMLKRI